MKRVKGFSLIEVIVAIVLLGIVATGIMPSLSFSYRNLRQSQVFTQDTYDYQEKIEKLIEAKKGEDPTDPLTTRTVSIFGKNITGHVIRVNDKTSSDMTVFVAKDSIPNVVPVIAAAPEIKVYNGAMLHTPVSPLDMTNASLTMSSQDPLITNETKPSFLMFVYRWYLSPEMDSSVTAPTKTKEYTAIKEWNEAKAALTFEQSNNLSFIPNIEADYNKLNIKSLQTALSLTEEEWINQFGNRYIMYGVTPYATSGRIGKEMLSNKIYIEAPKLVINSAKFTANNRIVEVTFNNDIKSNIEVDKILTNAALGTIVSAVKSNTDPKVMLLTFDQDLPTNTAVTGNQILRGGVDHNTYGEISIWGEGQPDGRFTIQPYVPIIATSLTVSPTSAVLEIDEELQLTATMLPAGANEALQWISSNTNIATVVDGLVTAKAFGTTTITVRTLDGRLSATSAMTVLSNSIPTAGLTLHLKSDESYKNVVSETVWSDLSGNNNHFRQNTGNKMPQQFPNALNGLPSIKFDGGDSLVGPVNGLTSSTGLLTFDAVKDSPFTMFIVSRAYDSSSQGTFISKSGGWGTAATYSFGRNTNDYFQQVIKGKNDANQSLANDYYNVHMTQWTGESSMSQHLYLLNGVLKNNHNSIGTIVNQNTERVAIGAANSGDSNYLKGDIMEVIIYNRVLSISEVDLIGQYFNNRYFEKVFTFDDKQPFNGGNPGYNHITNFKIENGFMSGTLNGNDPYILSKPNLNIEIGNSRKLVVRMKNQTTSTMAQIYFTTETSTGYSESKRVDFVIQPNSDYVDYVIDMSQNTNWVGLIKELRIDPATSVNTGSFSIDYVKLTY